MRKSKNYFINNYCLFPFQNYDPFSHFLLFSPFKLRTSRVTTRPLGWVNRDENPSTDQESSVEPITITRNDKGTEAAINYYKSVSTRRKGGHVHPSARRAGIADAQWTRKLILFVSVGGRDARDTVKRSRPSARNINFHNKCPSIYLPE